MLCLTRLPTPSRSDPELTASEWDAGKDEPVPTPLPTPDCIHLLHLRQLCLTLSIHLIHNILRSVVMDSLSSITICTEAYSEQQIAITKAIFHPEVFPWPYLPRLEAFTANARPVTTSCQRLSVQGGVMHDGIVQAPQFHFQWERNIHRLFSYPLDILDRFFQTLRPYVKRPCEEIRFSMLVRNGVNHQCTPMSLLPC